MGMAVVTIPDGIVKGPERVLPKNSVDIPVCIFVFKIGRSNRVCGTALCGVGSIRICGPVV